MLDLIYKDEVFQIVGAAMQVHRTLGCGFLEAVYQEALELELNQRGIANRPQCDFMIYYNGQRLSKSYIADFFVLDKIIVETKATGEITSRDEAQLLNYLKASQLKVGILINFGTEKLQWKRRVLTTF